MNLASLALKGGSWFLRFIEFCCAVIILGIFAYFLAALNNHNQHIPTWIKAVEGISGVAVLYTLCALFFVFCLGGMLIFSSLGMLLDLCFLGAFIYLAYATRQGRHSCSGNVNTPLGSGNTNVNNQVPFSNTKGGVKLPSLSTACKLNKACFAVAIVGLVFFLFSFFAELALMWNRRRQKSQPQTQTYDTYSEKRPFWKRKAQRESTYTNDSIEAQKRQADTLPTHTTTGDMRTSYQTDTTAVGDTHYAAPVQQNARVANQTTAAHPAHIGQANQAGYATQTTTSRVPGAATGAGAGVGTGHATRGTQQQQFDPHRDSYLQYSPQGAPASYPRINTAAEMPGEQYVQEAGNVYRSYNPSSSAA